MGKAIPGLLSSSDSSPESNRALRQKPNLHPAPNLKYTRAFHVVALALIPSYNLPQNPSFYIVFRPKVWVIHVLTVG